MDANQVFVEAWYAEQRTRRKALTPGLMEEYHRAETIWSCNTTEPSGPGRIVVSPSGKYSLTVTTHSSKSGGWHYSKGVLRHTQGAEIETVCRNYSCFPFTWAEDHPDGHDYLVCGEDYQGQTVIQLDTGIKKSYLPEAAADGHGFCWAGHSISPDIRTLMVDGCYWAAPYELVFYDFSEPMNLPYMQIHRESDVEDFGSWQPDGSYQAEVNRSYINITGHTLHGLDHDLLTADQYVELEQYAKTQGVPEYTLMECKKETLHWTRPSPLEAARGFLKSELNIRKALNSEVFPELETDILKHLDSLTPADRETLYQDAETTSLLEWFRTAKRETL